MCQKKRYNAVRTFLICREGIRSEIVVRQITWPKGLAPVGGVLPVGQSIARLYNSGPACASETTHIVSPQKWIVLAHGDKEIVVAS